MRHTLYVLTLSLLLPVSFASAQVPTLDPSGRASLPAEAPPPAAGPAPVIVNMPGSPEADAAKKAKADKEFYYSDDVGLVDGGREKGIYSSTSGPVPETHVIRAGDTLWDICTLYFSNPWEWPRIWSYNPTITNPHWIYPGDIVRLYEKKAKAISTSTTGDGEGVDVVADAPTKTGGFNLTRLAFVDAKELKDAFYIDGATDEKLLLSRGDGIYLKYGNKRPEAGRSYSVYDEIEKVVHPKTGKVLGAYVRIRGDLKVQSVRKERRARATITRTTNVLERGMKVGKILKTFGEVIPRRNEKTMQGLIVGAIDLRKLVGSRQLVIIDRGKSSGIEVGNRLFVIRRGDAYPELTNPFHQIGINDTRFPARSIGEIILVDVGSEISMALVTAATKEIGVGDMVLMRADKE